MPESQSVENPKFSVVDLGRLAEPATKLVEVVSKHIGDFLEPYHKGRNASAEAKALIIRANAEAVSSEIALRANNRLQAEAIRHQENMESIAKKALLQVNGDASPEGIDPDWLDSFFGKCKTFSNDDMQLVWSRILAGEANKPGSFSARTVSILANMDKWSAAAFRNTCKFICEVTATEYGSTTEITLKRPFLYAYDDFYTEAGINNNDLIELDALGLMRIDVLSMTTGIGKGPVRIEHGGKSLKLELPKPSLPTGLMILTEPGHELASIVDVEPHPNFIEYMKRYFAINHPEIKTQIV